MAMYECDYCGVEESFFPKVFLAVNTDDPVFPYHRNEFEEKFNELTKPYIEEHYVPEKWGKFWAWLGDNRIKFFCSEKCAQEFLKIK